MFCDRVSHKELSQREKKYMKDQILLSESEKKVNDEQNKKSILDGQKDYRNCKYRVGEVVAYQLSIEFFFNLA